MSKHFEQQCLPILFFILQQSLHRMCQCLCKRKCFLQRASREYQINLWQDQIQCYISASDGGIDGWLASTHRWVLELDIPGGRISNSGVFSWHFLGQDRHTKFFTATFFTTMGPKKNFVCQFFVWRFVWKKPKEPRGTQSFPSPVCVAKRGFATRPRP